MARYTVQTASGRKRKVIYAKSQAEARRKLTEAIADRDRGLTYDAEGLTVEGYLAQWLEDSVRGSVKVTTYQSYGSLVRFHVCPRPRQHEAQRPHPSTRAGPIPPEARRWPRAEDGQIHPHHPPPGAQAGREVGTRPPQCGG